MQESHADNPEQGVSHMVITSGGLPSEFVVFDPYNDDATITADIADAVEPEAMR